MHCNILQLHPTIPVSGASLLGCGVACERAFCPFAARVKQVIHTVIKRVPYTIFIAWMSSIIISIQVQ